MCSPEDLDVAVGKLRSHDAKTSPHSLFGECAEAIMSACARAHPDKRVRSLRDVGMLCSLPATDKRFVTQLNAAYSLLRHVPSVDASALHSESLH